MRRRFHIPTGPRLVSAMPDLDWDRWLAEAKTKREAREAEVAENEKHYASEMTGE
jgi:hypothetical protein